MVFKIVISAVLAYLLGGLNNAVIISKILKSDIRKEGSGNPGAMNMFRNHGFAFGVLTLLLDALKGSIACLLCWYIVGDFDKEEVLGLYIGALSVVVGHIFPIFMKFKGGKGIASTIGICFVINPLVTGISLLCGFVFILIAKIGCIGSFIIITPPLIAASIQLIGSGHFECALMVLAMYVIMVVKHWSNIQRLFNGCENKTYLLKKIRPKAKIKKEETN